MQPALQPTVQPTVHLPALPADPAPAPAPAPPADPAPAPAPAPAPPARPARAPADPAPRSAASPALDAAHSALRSALAMREPLARLPIVQSSPPRAGLGVAAAQHARSRWLRSCCRMLRRWRTRRTRRRSTVLEPGGMMRASQSARRWKCPACR
eukprot:scaffold17336_cov58-Phaeocystis_antarctica.AAC.7